MRDSSISFLVYFCTKYTGLLVISCSALHNENVSIFLMSHSHWLLSNMTELFITCLELQRLRCVSKWCFYVQNLIANKEVSGFFMDSQLSLSGSVFSCPL